MIAASIPLSLFFAVITMHLLGRTLNVVSLAGLAFSTGIVIDAALIVQGNVLRFMEQGRDAWSATVAGASEVLPALLASMLTSVAIFLPILFMQGLEGQLFKDLAITMSVSHAASLLLAGDDPVRHAPDGPAGRTIRLDRRHHGGEPARHRAAVTAGGLPAGGADRHDLEQLPVAAGRQHRDRARGNGAGGDGAPAAVPRRQEAAEGEVLQLYPPRFPGRRPRRADGRGPRCRRRDSAGVPGPRVEPAGTATGAR
ncbi:MAG: efflux RND transporter permease subunit [Proteobacteria bacterium]|nr:efflux RND transporter permease subunit [Pseudomonadota bacterium]MBP6107013.1 efflux RND transporter permease subunit [Steroidobacteraceae bacterium]MBP7014038.1 efflux RND transporter permease subunit [Steroidobacteraceae bacterium]